MKYVKAGFLIASLVTFASPALAQESITGAWELTMDTPQGANTVNLNLTQDGDKVTGELGSPMGSVPVTGTFAAGTLTLTANIEVQGTSFTLGFNGKLAGDAMTGTVKAGDFGEFPFTGKRAAAAAAPAPAPAAPAAPAAAATTPADATGKWDIVLSLPGVGDIPISAEFKQDGPKVTGSFASPAGELPVSGTMTGASLKLEFTAETPNGPLPITMTGELGAEGFVGKASIAGMGEADWKGTRPK